jgi:NADH-ubiquinone oxidoreductase chain 6
MNNLFIINEYFTNGYVHYVLNILSLLAIINAILIIVSKNPIVSILFLIGLFASISCYLILIGLSFIGLSYLIVYIGAVSILFLFILMLINIRISELQSNTKNSIPLAIIITIFFNYTLFQSLPYSIIISDNPTIFIKDALYNFPWNQLNNFYLEVKESKTEVLFVTSKTWEGNLLENDHITSIGNIMYTNYNLWLLITSLILLLAMVGAIVITIKQKR